MNIKTIISVTACLVAQFCYAKPAYRDVVEYELADGTIAEVMLHGDEHFHYMTDMQGNVLKNDNGKLIRAESLSEEYIAEHRRKSRFHSAEHEMSADGAYLAPRGLVILANFSDVKFKAENTQAAFDSLMNVKGYTYHGVSNSVRDYFIDQSHGKYTPEFDVYGPVTVNHTMKYYGENDADGYDKNAEQLIKDACNAAKEAYNLDFTKYDNDGDNFVDFVFVFYAGYGEADGASSNTIWQHMYKLKSYAGITCTIDGKTVDLYACGSELAYYNRKIASNPRDGISTCCHEFSHVCGLPDLYSSSGGKFTLGEWDIMDYGTSNNNGWTPPSYSAYEKFFCGWLTPTLLNSAANVVLPELNKSNAACLITATGTHNLNGVTPYPSTFYLLENRQQSSWDEFLPGHGLLITKITYNKSSWENNNVNSKNLQRVAIQPADNKLSEDGDAGDTYPGDSMVTAYNGITEYPITSITEKDDTIRFQFMGGGENLLLNIENDQKEYFTITPTRGGIVISNAEQTTAKIYDITGRIVATHKITENDTFIPLSQHGIYIINIRNINKTIFI